ncbi:uncharacterized protein LOC132163899 [Corylus avellana]|uniref:uncharacterized protein LOC132163899 n=1 Tax=Corylus avellana TaxID=13451 RepID=UPI00286D0ED9|nr:uncharacterized protein LOC132163899 [Corylus avellana]
MSAKVDTTSAFEPHSTKMSGSSTSSAPTTSSPKVSMFAAKSGFVIPKNKLSGSLIPIIRGGKKLGSGDAANEESTKLVQRKTKWGPDLTQDAAVKKGRALAYQTRLDQITQQLKLGSLEFRDPQGSPIAAENPDPRSPSPQSNNKNSELLELEKREAIGEILKLNPSYKVPPDYKPLLKESTVPIPVKKYPGFNLISLIFGPGGDNQKRLEKETGAKIRVYGTKAETGEKGEIKSSDGNEIQGAYEELYVQISAETFEKVDAAVSVIELLVTSVAGNLDAVSASSTSVSGDSMDVLTQSQVAATSHIDPTTLVNQGVQQPMAGPTHTSLQGQFQFHSPWFPSGQSHSVMHASPGFIPSPNSSAPLLNNPVHLSSSFMNPSNMPSLFGPRPIPAAGLNSILQNPHFLPRPQPPTQILQHPYMAQPRPLGHIGPLRNPSMMALQPSSAQPNFSAPPPFTGSQPPPTRPGPIMGSLMASLPQPMSSAPPGSMPDRPWTPAGSSSVWSGGPASASDSASLGLSNMGHMAPHMVPPNRSHPQNPQPGVASVAPPSNISTASLVSPMNFSSRPSPTQLSGAAANRPIGAPHFASNPPHQGGHPAAFSASLHQTSAPAPAPKSSVNLVLGSASIPLHGSGVPNSVSGSAPSFTPIKPPTVSAPTSGDFTFQPHRPHNLVSQAVPTSSRQPAIQSSQQVQLPALQVPSFQSGVPKITQPVNQVFQRPQFSNPVGQPQAPVSAAPYAQSPTGAHRLPAFPNANVAPRTPLSQMAPRSFSPAPQMPSLPGPMVPRSGNPLQLQQNYPARTRPEILLAPNQQFGNTFSFASSKPPSNSGGQQIYDPFSPTSVPTSKADG